MSYEEMMKDTDALVRRVLIQNAIGEWIIVIALMAAMVFVVILMFNEHREKMKNLRMIRRTMEDRDIRYKSAYAPTFTGEVEESNGKTFYRMGPPKKRE